jgi:hypothetical protein
MRLLMTIIIVFLAYFSFGLFIFLTSESFDEAMDFIRSGDASPRDQWISIFYTVLVHTPHNTYNRIRNFIKKFKK